MQNNIRILCIGDVVGLLGCYMFQKHVAELKRKQDELIEQQRLFQEQQAEFQRKQQEAERAEQQKRLDEQKAQAELNNKRLQSKI